MRLLCRSHKIFFEEKSGTALLAIDNREGEGGFVIGYLEVNPRKKCCI